VVFSDGHVEFSIVDTHLPFGDYSHENELIFLVLNDGHIPLFGVYFIELI